MPLRLIFMGTPDFAVPTLIELAGRAHEIAAVYTRAAKPGGRRGLELISSPIEREAKKLGLVVRTPASLKSTDVQAELTAFGADAAVVVAYGMILPKPVLEAPQLGCFNLHASLLPRWRGAAPINRSIMAGDAETGVTVMKMDEGLDTGSIAMMERVPIPPDMTAGQLHDALSRIGADLMVRAMSALERGSLQLTPQPAEHATYAAKINKAETRIDWRKPWKEVHNRIRGLSPFPGAWCELPSTGRVKLLRSTRGEGTGAPGTVLDHQLTIACADGAVRIIELQRAGGRPMRAEEFLRGTAIGKGTQLA
jgi:methionyl-tRNA formyltransferase